VFELSFYTSAGLRARRSAAVNFAGTMYSFLRHLQVFQIEFLWLSRPPGLAKPCRNFVNACVFSAPGAGFVFLRLSRPPGPPKLCPNLCECSVKEVSEVPVTHFTMSRPPGPLNLCSNFAEVTYSSFSAFRGLFYGLIFLRRPPGPVEPDAQILYTKCGLCFSSSPSFKPASGPCRPMVKSGW
jgi:hypothetical protein